MPRPPSWLLDDSDYLNGTEPGIGDDRILVMKQMVVTMKMTSPFKIVMVE